MDFYLLVLGIGLIVFGYLRMFICYFLNRKDNMSDLTGFDIAREVSGDDVHIVESQKTIISKYLIQRQVIHMTKEMYYGSDSFSLAMASYLASLSIIKNRYLVLIGRVLPFIDFVNKSSFIMLVISYFIHTVADARIGIILGGIITVYQYFCLQIFGECVDMLKEKQLLHENVFAILKKWYSIHVILFVSGLVFILRFVVILIG